jgi:hypothetical protein
MTPLERTLFRALTAEFVLTGELRNRVSVGKDRPALHDVAACLRILRRRSQEPTWVFDRVERQSRGTDGHAWRRVPREKAR